jgi:hypothetical protein
LATQRAASRYGQRYRLIVAIALLAGLAAFGGASRYDEDQQMLARLAAIAAIAASLWPLKTETLRRRKWLLAMVAAAYGLVLLQLIPLPPSLWAMLPGHDIYARIAVASGTMRWRPLSLTPDLTINTLGALLPATAATLVALYCDSRSRLWLAWSVVAIALVSALAGLVQLAPGGALRFYRESSENAPVGLFANRNHQAALMACALPFVGALAGLWLRRGGRPRVVAGATLAAVAMLLFASIPTGSRMGLLLVAIGLGVGVGAYTATGQRLMPVRRLQWAGVAAALIGASGATAAAAMRSGAVDRLMHTDPASESRTAMVGPLLDTARTFLPWGAGFGSFSDVYRRFEPDALLSTIYMNQAHNEPLQLAIEGGVPALILLGLFVWWWTRTAVAVVRTRESVTRRTLGIAAIGMTLILMASSLVDYPLRTPLLGALFAIAAVMMMRATPTPARP